MQTLVRWIFTFLLMFCAGADAHAEHTDISRLRLNDIALGGGYKEAVAALPCRSESTSVAGGKQWVSKVSCEHFGVPTDSNLEIKLDQHGKVWSVLKKQNFPVLRDFTDIRAQMLARYGQPDKSARNTSTIKNADQGYIINDCWGACSYRILAPNGLWKGGRSVQQSASEASFQITYFAFSKYLGKDDAYFITYSLHDPAQKKRLIEWLYPDNQNRQRLTAARADLNL